MTAPRTFQPQRLTTGQWIVRELETDRICGQAVRHQIEADARARKLADTYSGVFRPALSDDANDQAEWWASMTPAQKTAYRAAQTARIETRRAQRAAA